MGHRDFNIASYNTIITLIQTPETIIDIHFGGPTYVISHDNEARSTHQHNPKNCHSYNVDARQYNETNYSEGRTSLFHTHIHVTGDQFSSTPFHVPPERGAGTRDTFQSRHNSARNFRYNGRLTTSQLPTPTSCTWCNARLFHHETETICCLRGKSSDEGRHFRQHIRGYNHIFAFTSLGVHLDNSLAVTGRGIYTFCVQGSIYHNIGGLHPNEGDRPRFMQLYIYDTGHELQNKMLENPQLHENVVSKLQHILHLHNPFVHIFRQLALRTYIHQCSLIIKERHANQPQYNLPTTSEVAAIIVVGDVETLINGRDIKVTTHA
ncbi:hypothetical protein Lal_00004228 [Lupinus albus]|nr:hypothetical protein Lal_00004228 [Lupinus albus]